MNPVNRWKIRFFFLKSQFTLLCLVGKDVIICPTLCMQVFPIVTANSADVENILESPHMHSSAVTTVGTCDRSCDTCGISLLSIHH